MTQAKKIIKVEMLDGTEWAVHESLSTGKRPVLPGSLCIMTGAGVPMIDGKEMYVRQCPAEATNTPPSVMVREEATGECGCELERRLVIDPKMADRLKETPWRGVMCAKHVEVREARIQRRAMEKEMAAMTTVGQGVSALVAFTTDELQAELNRRKGIDNDEAGKEARADVPVRA